MIPWPLIAAMTVAQMSTTPEVRPEPVNLAPLKVALVVGYNKSDTPDTPSLRYADDDAIATHRMLQSAGVQSTLLVDPDDDTRRMQQDLGEFNPPTYESVVGTFERLNAEIEAANQAGRVTEFYFVYSGHGGLENGEGYIVLHNGRLTRSELHSRILERSKATHNQIIIDACKSFFVVFEKGAGGQRAFYPGHYVKDVGASLFRNTGFILSTSSDRDSHEWEKFQAGVFSHEVRSGLWGAADLNADGSITYAELGAFLTNANQGIPNPRYRPDFVVRPPGPPPGKLSEPIMIWPETPEQSALLLDKTNMGHVFVENAQGARVMDVNVQSKEPVLLHLPDERPLFLRKGDNSDEYLIREDGMVELSRIIPQPSTYSGKGALHLAFEKLFSVPFSDKDISTYEDAYELYGDPLRLDLVERFDILYRKDQAKKISMWVGTGAGALGLGTTLWAVSLQKSGENATQEKAQRLNQQIDYMNVASVGFYSVAATAGLTWIISHYWPLDDPLERPAIAITPQGGANFSGFNLTMGW